MHSPAARPSWLEQKISRRLQKTRTLQQFREIAQTGVVPPEIERKHAEHVAQINGRAGLPVPPEYAHLARKTHLPTASQLCLLLFG